MSDNNPYLTPQIAETAGLAARGNLDEYSDEQIRRLYYRSSFIVFFSVMLLVIALVTALILIGEWGPALAKDPFLPLMVGILVCSILIGIGSIVRQTWGRVLGIIACFVILLHFSVGSLIVSIVGLISFFTSPELFGPNRVTHAKVKAAHKAVKAQSQRR